VGGTVSWNDTGLPAQLPRSAEVTAQRGLVEQHRDMTPSQVVSEGRRGGVAGLGWPRARRSLARGSEFLERGGDSSEGASSPRARRRFARGGVQPSSRVGTHPRGRQALERGGDLWRGVWPSSEAEARPRGTAASRLVGRYGFLGRGPFSAPGRGHAECASWFVGVFVYFNYF
jgi:hypothetical protein